MLLVSGSSQQDHHDVGPGHPEGPDRVDAALRGISAAGLEDAVIDLEPRCANEEELQRVHSAEYLQMLRSFCEAGGGPLDADTVASEGSWDTALLAAGALLQAIDTLSRGSGEAAFVAARPPGHHAMAEHAMGFCLINNIAVAAAALADSGERVAIVDWDVHHGNGTQDIFWDDPRVLYMSIHQWPLYPGTGAADETGGPQAKGLTVNVPLPPNATGDVAIRAFDDVLAPVVDRFDPTWVLVSAGFDAHRADSLASLQLTAADFALLAKRVKDVSPPGKLILTLEGGYDLNALTMSVGATLSAIMGGHYLPEETSCGGPGDIEVARAKRLLDELGC